MLRAGVTVFHDADADNFLLLEEWTSKEHHQKYIQAISDSGVMEQLLAFMQSPPQVVYYDRKAL